MSELDRTEPIAPAPRGLDKHAGHAAPDARAATHPERRGPDAKARLDGAQAAAAAVVQDRIVGEAREPAWALGEAKLVEMTLADFDRYTYEHPDWLNHPAQGLVSTLWQLLVASRALGLVAGLGAFPIRDLIAAGLLDANRAALLRYAAAVSRTAPDVELQPAETLPRALDYGRALLLLDTALGPSERQSVIRQDTPQGPMFDLLIDKQLLAPFVGYVREVGPLLTNQNGYEITSFMAFFQETGGKPTRYAHKLRYVRTHHHFEVAALEQLVANEADLSRRRPLTVILHSASDWNGSFMRNPAITALIRDRRNNAILVEGMQDLAEAKARLTEVAARYGQNGKIDQVLLAGHGEARAMELAARRDEKGALHDEPIDLSTNAAHSDDLLRAILGLLDPAAPHRRIALYACLTNSNVVPADRAISADPVRGAREIADGLRDNESLSARVRRLAAEMKVSATVIGSSASGPLQGPGTRFVEPGSGAITLYDANDPTLIAPKIEYVRRGVEPGGALRALVECWSVDQAGCRAAVEERLAGKTGAPAPGSTWWAMVLDVLLRRALAVWDRPDRLVALQRASDVLGELQWDNGGTMAPALSAVVDKADAPALFSPLLGWADQLPWVAVAISQAWMRDDPAQVTHFLSTLERSYPTVLRARPYIDADPKYVPTVLRASSNITGKGIYALSLLLGTPQDPALQSHVRALRQGRAFPPWVQTTIAGAWSEPELHAVLDRQPAQSARQQNAAPPNVDLDGDGKEDILVEPAARDARTRATVVVLVRPRPGAAPLGMLAKDASVRVTGLVGQYAMVALPGESRPGFVLRSVLE